MTASAQGADTSAYQQPLTAAVLKAAGLSFAFAKATNGTAGEDPDFAVSWQAIAEAGLHRGAYHELTGEDPLLQAGTFMAVVAGRGLKAGDMLAVVASDYAVAGWQAKAFLDAVKAAAGPKCPVLLYSDLSALPSLAECSGYPLWLAYYADSAPGNVAPWDRWMFWQYQAGGGADGGDRDAFNGTAAELDAWIASYAGTPAVPNWTETLVKELPVLKQGATGTYVRTVQFQLGERGHSVKVDGVFGPVTTAAVRAAQASAGIGQDGIVGPLTWGALFGV